MKVNRYALNDFMDGEGLRLTDLHERTKEQDDAGKGVSISFLSELRSGTKTEASAAVVKKIADALGVRPRSIATPSDDDVDEANEEAPSTSASRPSAKTATKTRPSPPAAVGHKSAKASR